jgi:cytochrome c oxidase subunit 2
MQMKIVVDTPEEYAAWLKENAPKTIVQAVKNAAAEAKAAESPAQTKDSTSAKSKDTTVVAQAEMK